MWILIASIPPLMWAFNNLADEYMAKHHFAKNGVLLILLSACFEIVPALGGMAFYEPVHSVPLKDAFILGLMGFWLSLSFIPYIFAIQSSNASNAIPIFQTIPVMLFFLGWLFLGETATVLQIVAALMIIGSAAAISWDYHHSRIDLKPLCLLLITSLMISAYLLVGRYYTFQYDPLAMNFWLWFGSGFLAICCIMFRSVWRQQSMALFLSGNTILLSLFFFQITSQIIAGGLWIMALKVAPSTALMETIGGLQPAYVLGLSILLGKLFPSYFQTIVYDKVLLIKLALIVIMMIGVYLISL